MFGTLDQQEIEELLGRQMIGRLGCHADGMTYVVPISYAYTDGYIYCHSMDGLKMAMLRKNGQVCFQVDDTKELSNWRSVICWGDFEELDEEAGRIEALSLLNKRHFPVRTSQKMQINAEWPFVEAETGEVKGIFFRIKVDNKTGRFEHADASGQFAT
ncbi:pyridoxamine 5'-phosphate oxidase family protein [Terrimonas sp. NA20]|uniref:Pyridoxamine 5'-phosphate oxidase family protein n=1 Tax=Terrimonas ginsenosidimutans TaxID=2908004 RepID=A0ABS9KVE2_9BACT|nr:pyridoxamine 5'-phosphate oxidase family protein [Terrimonas ginsenosidimutans]MCG2616291.1 pyridoxamine 5'-phosphate oxidase family protein [Terrimonas ginsenosidimutans]